MAAAHTSANLAVPIASALSAMQDKLPEALAVKDPRTWTTQDVSVWVMSWGPPFTSAAAKVRWFLKGGWNYPSFRVRRNSWQFPEFGGITLEDAGSCELVSGEHKGQRVVLQRRMWTNPGDGQGRQVLAQV